MLSMSKKSSVLALGAALTLTLSACGDEEDTAIDSPGADAGVAEEQEAPEADPTPVAEIDRLEGVNTSVTLDPAFVEGITSLMLTPGVVGGAEFDGATGRLMFPITGGNVTYFDPESGVEPFVKGQIEHEESGLSLTGGGMTVELTDFVVDPADSVLTGTVSVDGEVAAEDAPLFFLDGRTLNPLEVNEAEGTAVLEGTTVSLTAEAAELLNSTFGVDALTEFFPVGVAEITVALPE